MILAKKNWLVRIKRQYCSLILNQHQPPATSQSVVLLSHNKSAPATSHSQANTANRYALFESDWVMCFIWPFLLLEQALGPFLLSWRDPNDKSTCVKDAWGPNIGVSYVARTLLARVNHAWHRQCTSCRCCLLRIGACPLPLGMHVMAVKQWCLLWMHY